MTDIISWSPVDASNNAAPPAGWPENMQPSAVNDCARAMMGAIRRNYDSVLSGALVLPYLSTAGGTVTGTINAAGIAATVVNASVGGTFGALNVTGGLAVYGTLNVAGATTLPSLHVTGNSTLDGPLTAAGVSATSLGVSGGVTAGGLAVTGGTQLNYLHVTGGPADIDNGIRINTGGLSVAGGTELNYLHVYGGAAADIDNGVRINTGGLSVAGGTELNYLHVSADADITGSLRVNGGGRFSNNLLAPVLQGGPGNAGNLQTWNNTNHVCFRWDSAILYYRIDEVLERRICTSEVGTYSVGIVGSAGGPTGYALYHYNDSMTPFYSYCDFASDVRLKENIKDTEIDALAAIVATPVREFDWGEAAMNYLPLMPPHTAIGLVAQELLETMPDAVGVADFSKFEQMASLPFDLHNVVYERVTAYLVRAVQQLKGEVDELRKGENRV